MIDEVSIETEFLEGQYDIEDAIAAIGLEEVQEKPLTVSQYVRSTGWPEWRVRYAIANEHLEVDRSVRPMVITGGEMPLTVREWHIALDPELRKVSPSRYSFSDGGRQLNILPLDNRIRVYKIATTKAMADDQAREIKRMQIQRRDG